MFSVKSYVLTLLMAFIMGVPAQGTPALSIAIPVLTNPSASINPIGGSATSLSSFTTSSDTRSFVPFNTGPDPFPIVLPSTVTRSWLTTLVTPDQTFTTPGVQSSDPFVLPGSRPSTFGSDIVAISTPADVSTIVTSANTARTTDLLSSTSTEDTATVPISTNPELASTGLSSPLQSNAESITNPEKHGWQMVDYRVSAVLTLVALCIALL